MKSERRVEAGKRSYLIRTQKAEEKKRKASEYNKKYYQINRERELAISKAYNEKNREEINHKAREKRRKEKKSGFFFKNKISS